MFIWFLIESARFIQIISRSVDLLTTLSNQSCKFLRVYFIYIIGVKHFYTDIQQKLITLSHHSINL